MTYQKLHEIDTTENNGHLAEIVNSIKVNGWQGLPLLASGDQLLNGSHRATACEILDIDPNVHQIEVKIGRGTDDYIDLLWDSLITSSDTEEIYRSLSDLLDENAIDEYSVQIIKAECENETN